MDFKTLFILPIKNRTDRFKLNFDIDDIADLSYKKTESLYRRGKFYYSWTILYKGNLLKLRPVPREEYPLTFDISCDTCGKLISEKIRLSTIFSIMENTIPKLNKKFHTKCLGCSCKSNAINGIEKQRKTCLDRYGFVSNLCMPGFQERAKQTLIAKHGENYKQLAAFKAQDTYFKRTGYTHTRYNPEAEAKRHASWAKTASEWTQEEKDEMTRKRMETYAKPSSPGLFGGIIPKSKSKISERFLEDLKSYIPFKIEEEYSEGIYPYHLDFVVDNTVAIEFYGDYWHANPDHYDIKDEFKNIGKASMTAEEIWQKDQKRIQFIVEKLKMPVIIIWESEYKKNKKKCLQNLTKEIMMIMKEKIETKEEQQ